PRRQLLAKHRPATEVSYPGGMAQASLLRIERMKRMSHSLSRLAPMRWQLASAAAVSALLASAGGMLLGAGPAQAASNLPTISIAATHTSITVGGALQSGGVS